jgi:hypothetical protein
LVPDEPFVPFEPLGPFVPFEPLGPFGPCCPRGRSATSILPSACPTGAGCADCVTGDRVARTVPAASIDAPRADRRVETDKDHACSST